MENIIPLGPHGIIDIKAPLYLFKYQPITEYSLLNLEKEQLWASHPSAFNDPHEFKFTQIGTNLEENELDQLINEMDQFKVVCFSQDPANTLMWAHYANFHKGMCLGFYNQTLTYQINYSDEYPEVDFSINNPKQRALQLHRVINSKSKVWEYEMERRINLIPGTPSETCYPGNLFLVIFGIRTSIDDIRKVRLTIKDPNVQFWQCEYMPNQYKLDFTLAPQ